MRTPRRNGGLGFWLYWCSLVGACTLHAAERTRRMPHGRLGPLRLFVTVLWVTLIHSAVLLGCLHLGKAFPGVALLLILIFVANYVIQVSRLMKLAILGEN